MSPRWYRLCFNVHNILCGSCNVMWSSIMLYIRLIHIAKHSHHQTSTGMSFWTLGVVWIHILSRCAATLHHVKCNGPTITIDLGSSAYIIRNLQLIWKLLYLESTTMFCMSYVNIRGLLFWFNLYRAWHFDIYIHPPQYSPQPLNENVCTSAMTKWTRFLWQMPTLCLLYIII